MKGTQYLKICFTLELYCEDNPDVSLDSLRISKLMNHEDNGLVILKMNANITD